MNIKPHYFYIIIPVAIGLYYAAFALGQLDGNKNSLVCRLDRHDMMRSVWDEAYNVGVQSGKTQGFIQGYVKGATYEH